MAAECISWGSAIPDHSKLFGPALGDVAAAFAAADSSGGGLFNAKLEPNKVSDAFSGIFERLDAGEIRKLAIVLGKQCELHREGDKRIPLTEAQIKLHFTGHVGGMYRWIKWGIEVQFADFFDGLSPLVTRMQEMMSQRMTQTPNESQNPQDDTASSGG